MRVTAIVTARGGSKGIVGKNIKPLGGKPLLAWTIEAALACRYVDQVVLSTDDAAIADVGRAFGGRVPFMRPSELAQDNTPHNPVIRHALETIETLDGRADETFVLLQPTSPFRSAQHMNEAIELAIERAPYSVISVCEAATHPYFSKKLDSQGALHGFMARPEGYLARQVIEPAYQLNGAIYICNRDHFLKNESLYTDPTFAYVMDSKDSVDLDTMRDWRYAEFVIQETRRTES